MLQGKGIAKKESCKRGLLFKILLAGFLLLGLQQEALYAAPEYSSRTSNTFSQQDVERFTAAMNEIKKYYVTTVDDQTLFDNAIRGMLNGLDPHSGYLDMNDFAELKSHTTGQFAGLGIEVTPDEGYLRVISPLDDTPAKKVGLKTDDIILKIDNVLVKDMSLDEAISKMRGPKDSKVTLTIYRKSEQRVFNQVVTRQIIQVQSAKGKLLEDGYGFVRISQFQDPTLKELKTTVQALISQNHGQNLKGFILDLRNNPGGLLDSAVAVSDEFLDSRKLKGNDLIVYTKGRVSSSAFEAHATPGDILNGTPMIVLINEGSASGAEIVAGALQDHHRAVIMGTRSFGKGSVQTVLPLDSLRGIKLTTALYYTPNGRTIQATGIEPDIVAPPMDVKKDNKEDMLALLTLHEADFKNHLKTAAKVPLDNADPTVDPLTLASADFQLYEALNLLKGLNITKQNK